VVLEATSRHSWISGAPLLVSFTIPILLRASRS
jgi:hypothetical protein